MTDDELKAIEDIASRATPGPWHLAIASSGDEAESNIEAGHTDLAYDIPNADAIFITHARENVPALVAEVRRLRAVLTRYAYPDVGGPILDVNSYGDEAREALVK